MGSLKWLLIAPTFFEGARNRSLNVQALNPLNSGILFDMSPNSTDHFNMENLENRIISTTWIENLALDEVTMEESGVINFDEHLNPRRLLEESSIDFMEDLKELFEIYATKFNEFRGGASNTSSIKLFKISNTINDFMLYRNTLKLVVARRSEEVISIGFLSNTGGAYSARMTESQTDDRAIHEIRAHVGAFNKISWRFKGEPVDKEALVKHYLTEFIKHSAR